MQTLLKHTVWVFGLAPVLLVASLAVILFVYFSLVLLA
jgi:ABC-type multidrug transport system permease subunit